MAGIAAVSLLLVACKGAEVPDQAVDLQPLSAAQISDMLADNTVISAASEQDTWAVYYEADGSERGLYNDSSDTGTWRVEGGALCSNWKTWGSGERCFTLYRNDAGEVLGFSDGEKAWTGVIEPGNRREL